MDIFFTWSYSLFKLLDKGFIELLGPMGITSVLSQLTNKLRLQQTGFVYNYFCFMIFCFLIAYFYTV